MADAVESGRWAVILKETGVVSDIKIMEGGVEPEITDDAKHTVDLEEVPAGVKIGMVRGGPVDSVGGFGFPEGTTPSATPPEETGRTKSRGLTERGERPAAKAGDDQDKPAPAKAARRGKKAA